MMDEKWFVAVAAGRWQTSGILAAKKMGLRVVGIDAVENSFGFSDCDHAIVADITDGEKIVEELKRLDKNYIGVASFCSEVGMKSAAKVRESFQLPGPDLNLTEKLVNKELQRTAWQDSDLPNPRWYCVNSAEDARKAIDQLATKVILKPVDSSGSRGISVLTIGDSDPDPAIRRAFDFSKSGSVLVEEFIEGIEFAIESFSQKGEFYPLAVSQKKKVEGTHGTVANEYHHPECSKDVLDRIKKVVGDAYQAIGYLDGPGHAEVIVDENDDVYLVEVAGRGGGFSVFENYVPKISQFDLPSACVKNLVGEEVPPPTTEQMPGVLRFFPSKTGTIRSVEGFVEANQIDGVEAVAFAVKGQNFNQAIADGDRLGYVFAKGESLAVARELAAKAEGLIKFRYE